MNKSNTFQDLLDKIIVFSGNLSTPGLFEGKMGLVVFFFAYAAHSSDELYEELAIELLEEVYDGVSIESSIGFKDGLCGIGWGLEYIMQNDMVMGDSLEVCEEIDRKIMEWMPARMNNMSYDKGLEGLLHYMLFHIKGCMRQNSKERPFDPDFLSEMYDALNKKRANSIDPLLRKQYADFISKGYEPKYKPSFEAVIGNITIDDVKIMNYPISLHEGLAGAILKKIGI